MYKYIRDRRLSKAKSEIEMILSKLRIVLKEKYDWSTSIMVTGSVKRNLVTVNEEGHFDLDYNLCLEKLSKEERKHLQRLKDRVRTELDIIAGSYNYSYGQNSTSVITLEKENGEYSLDLGILVKNNKQQFCRLIRDKNIYRLAEIALLYDTSKKEKYIEDHGAFSKVSEQYLKRKNKNQSSDSFHLYLEVVNSVYNQMGGKKMSKVSGNNHTREQINHHANQKNSNNSASRAAANNRANQMNPNNAAYRVSRGK